MNSEYFKIKKSVLLSWITSYSIVLLIPLLINGIIYAKSLEIIEKQITDSNVEMLHQLQSEFDTHVNEVENLSFKINANTKLNYLVKSKDLQEILSSYSNVNQVLAMNEDFNVYALTDRFIGSVYIYFKDKDLIWCDSNLYTKKDFYDVKISNEHVSFEAWKNDMDKIYNNENMQFYSRGIDEKGIKTVAHFQSLPINTSNSNVNLAIIFNQDRLNEYIKSISKINNSTVYIVDQNNTILFSSYNGASIAPIEKYDNMKGDIGLYAGKYEGKDVVVSYISSKQSEWKYVCIIPKSVFKEKVVYVRNIIIAGFLCCMLLGGIAIAWFAKRNYNPLNELVLSIKSGFGINKDKEQLNEFGFIKDSIRDVYNEREFINKKLELQNHALYLNFISRLLKGRFNSESSVQQGIESYGIKFDSEFFIVIVFYIEASFNIRVENLPYSEENYMEPYENFILEELKRLLGNEYGIYSAKPDEMLTCLINIADSNIEQWKNSIDAVIRQLKDTIKEEINLEVTVSVSELNKKSVTIHKAYEEAMEAMEYRLLDLERNTIYYDEVKLRGQKNYYYYSIEEEQKLINSIKIGNFEKAQEIVQEVLQLNLSTKTISVYMAKFIIIDIISTFIKALNNEGALNENAFSEDGNFMERVLSHKTVDGMKVELINCLQTICERMHKHSQGKNKNKLVEKVKSLVEKNYHSENLNVSTLADEMGMNSKYISSLYKECTGESIVDLINRVRINEVKVLLKEEMSIAAASKKVGFNNSNALIRAFKKYEGITPGQFKEIK